MLQLHWVLACHHLFKGDYEGALTIFNVCLQLMSQVCMHSISCRAFILIRFHASIISLHCMEFVIHVLDINMIFLVII